MRSKKHIFNIIMAATLMAASLSTISISWVYAAGMVVETDVDELATNGLCSLREAIANANTDYVLYPDCIAGSGSDTITFVDGVNFISIVSQLVVYDTDGLTIDGGGDVSVSGNLSSRIFVVKDEASLTLNAITLTSGVATSAGGGAVLVSTNTASVFVNNSALVNNISDIYGGAIYSLGNVRIVNSTIAENATGAGDSGTIHVSGNLSVSNTTFSNNGGNYNGLDVYVGNTGINTASFYNNIFASNNVNKGGCQTSTTAVSLANNIFQRVDQVVNFTCGTGAINGNILGVSADLGSMLSSPTLYFPLNPGSPAIDAGNDTICLVVNTDQRGVGRPQGDHCDIGSYEYVFPENVQNGGFDTYPTDASMVPSDWKAVNFSPMDGKSIRIKQDGYASVKITGLAGVTKKLTQTLALSGSNKDQITFSYWVRGNSVPVKGACRGQVIFYNDKTKVDVKTIQCPTGTFDFKQEMLTFNPLEEYSKVVIRFTYAKDSGRVWFDGVSLVKEPIR